MSQVAEPEKQRPLNVDRDPVASPDGEVTAPQPGQSAATIGRDNGKYTLQRNVDEVVLNATVLDDKQHMVTSLAKEDFRVSEDGVAQTITSFQHQDIPISLGILVDNSGSMRTKRQAVNTSALDLVQHSNPQDESFVVNFSDEAYIDQDFTSNVDNIESRLLTVKPGHRTALLDAIYFGLNKMKQAKNERKALLVVSDGGDNRSRYTESEVRSVVRESDVQIYSIGIFDQYAPTREEQLGPILLHDVSEETGGQLFRVDDLADMADIATKISAELRNQYVLGYKSDDAKRDGKWRKLKVKLVPPEGLPQLTVHARTGYYAPLQ
jgi:Ca-activated chloride channel family protein